MKGALIGVVLAVLGSGCGVISTVEVIGFDDMRCRPTDSGEDTICSTKIHFDVDRGVAEEDGVYGSVESGWGYVSFDFAIDHGGSHSWSLAYLHGGPCEGGEVTLSGYVELLDEYETSHEETSASDSRTTTVDIRCED